ncbi:MAG: hypothetical protein AAGG50_22290, partial [Bacteroidota bacterium]
LVVTTRHRLMSESLQRRIVQSLAVVSLAAGAFGMMFCFPFLWSARMEDLVGAGFPFVGGAVLFGCGVIALALTVRSGEED